jgi:hypothetical protein
MAPDGQVRIQASGIRLDHSLLSLVSEGEATFPLLTPSSLSRFFCRWKKLGWAWNVKWPRMDKFESKRLASA